MEYKKTSKLLFNLIPLLDKKFIRAVDQEFRAILTATQASVMSILTKKKATMTELSNEMLMSKQQMTPLIDKLVSEGFVQREYDPIDRRIIRISLTPLGLNMLKKVEVKIFALLDKKLQYLDENDLLCLKDALSDVLKIINKIN